MSYYIAKNNSDYLMHHGILGQKWGVRRYQNEDGSLTDAGRKRYYKTIIKEYKNGNYSKFIGDNISQDHKNKLISLYRRWTEWVDKFDKESPTADAKAYKKTYEWFEKNDKPYLTEIIKRNGGRSDDLDEFHDFRTLFEGFQDEEWSKLKSSKEAEKAFDAYFSEVKNVANEILIGNADLKIKGVNISKETEKIVDDCIEKIIYKKD